MDVGRTTANGRGEVYDGDAAAMCARLWSLARRSARGRILGLLFLIFLFIVLFVRGKRRAARRRWRCAW